MVREGEKSTPIVEEQLGNSFGCLLHSVKKNILKKCFLVCSIEKFVFVWTEHIGMSSSFKRVILIIKERGTCFIKAVNNIILEKNIQGDIAKFTEHIDHSC